MHKAVGLIPTRFNSRRLPGKSLKMIGNFPMIIHTYLRAKMAKKLDDVYICCDTKEVFQVAKKFKAKVLITSKNQISIEIAKLINPFLLHFPLTIDEELPTFAFPYSPVHSDRGCVYEFSLNHLLELNNPMDAFQIKISEV